MTVMGWCFALVETRLRKDGTGFAGGFLAGSE
jgi:hypothetical protein